MISDYVPCWLCQGLHRCDDVIAAMCISAMYIEANWIRSNSGSLILETRYDWDWKDLSRFLHQQQTRVQWGNQADSAQWIMPCSQLRSDRKNVMSNSMASTKHLIGSIKMLSSTVERQSVLTAAPMQHQFYTCSYTSTGLS